MCPQCPQCLCNCNYPQGKETVKEEDDDDDAMTQCCRTIGTRTGLVSVRVCHCSELLSRANAVHTRASLREEEEVEEDSQTQFESNRVTEEEEEQRRRRRRRRRNKIRFA